MTIFIGTFDVASPYLPSLERVCDEYGGSIQVTGAGVSYELPALLEHQEPRLLQVLAPISAEIQKRELRKAA